MGLFSKLKESLKSESKQTGIFSDIVGHQDIKDTFNMSLSAEQPVHILLVGPPGTCKTQFMQKIMDLKKDKAYFTIGSHSTKAGMVNQLFEKRPRYLLVDEIEHMPATDQTALLSLMESGILSETKIKKTRQTQLKTWVFATSNGTKKISDPLLSRFVVIHLEKYTAEQFAEIAIKVLTERENVNMDVAKTIAEQIYENMKTPNVRDAIKLGRLCKNQSDVIKMIKVMGNGGNK